MKNKRLLRSIGEIDEKFIEEAQPLYRKAKRRMNIRWGAVAACFLVMIPLAFLTVNDSGENLSLNDSVVNNGFNAQYSLVSETETIQEMRPNRGREYDNIGSLTENSEKIAVVQVMDTVNQVKVIQPIYNCKKGERIEILTFGKMEDGTYLLFMEKEGEKYAELDPENGRFLVENGKITNTGWKWNWKEEGMPEMVGIRNGELEEVLATVRMVLELQNPEKLVAGAKHHEYMTNDGTSFSYLSMENLMRKSDVVCTVTIGDYYNRDEKSYFMATADQVYKGNLSEDSLMVVTENFCEEMDSKMTQFEMVDDPWMHAGEQYLVFLKERTDGMYRIVGDAQGRFALHDGKITALKYLYPDRVKKGLNVKAFSMEKWQKGDGVNEEN